MNTTKKYSFAFGRTLFTRPPLVHQGLPSAASASPLVFQRTGGECTQARTLYKGEVTSRTMPQSRLPKHPVYAKFVWKTQPDADDEVEQARKQLGRERKRQGQALMDGLEYAMRIVKARDYDNFASAMMMPNELRGRVIALLALNAELSMIRQKIKRHSGVTGIYQLQFWRDGLHVLDETKPGPMARQPVLTVLDAYGDPAEVPLLERLIDARQATLGDRPFETLDKLEYNSELIYATISLCWMNAMRTHYKYIREHGEPTVEQVMEHAHFDESTPLYKDCHSVQDVVRKMARATGILITLRATIPLLQEGVILLPKDCLEIHKLDEEQIARNANPEALRKLVGDLCQVANDHLVSARKSRSFIQPSILRQALMVQGLRCDYLLHHFQCSGYNVQHARLQSNQLLPSTRLWWRKLWRRY